ncbi:MAG: glycosyltransferase [Bacteroidetes bacterium]|nr:glycosyltransferase [Bacteroidota bacterium]
MDDKIRLENTPLITVITSVFNGADYLEETILSVIDQTYSPIEYIVIDGGSTDGTLDILRRYHAKITLWISERDTGIYDAWNKALKHAKGEWLCFIGSDDFFLDSNVIEKIVPHLEYQLKRNKKLIYGKVLHISEDKSRVIEELGESWDACKTKFEKRMTVAHCGSFHHKTLFDENGSFNTKFKITGDYEFLLRAYLKDKELAAFVDLPVVKMRTGGISGSLKNRLQVAEETAMARKLNGLNDFSMSIFLWKMRIRIYEMLRRMFGTKLSNQLADFYRGLIGKRKRWSV